MNANEMADLMILFDSGRIYEHSEEIATMLRQQQEKLTKYELRHVAQRDRIAILEMQHKQQQAEIEALKSKTLTDEEDTECQYCKQGCIRCDARKTLTDEEIIEIWSGMETDTGEQNIAFARAILRKAQND